jgi:hypothetical protein|nr:MAG TPA_asm: hypothetical protein [Caudoviricetes sp.]
MRDAQALKDLTAQVLSNLSDQGAASNAMADINTDYAEAMKTIDDYKQQVDSLTQANEKLKKDNMALFLKVDVGSANVPAPKVKEEDYSIDALYNDKGRLIY